MARVGFVFVHRTKDGMIPYAIGRRPMQLPPVLHVPSAKAWPCANLVADRAVFPGMWERAPRRGNERHRGWKRVADSARLTPLIPHGF